MYILTGASCSGKTTILEMLKELGHEVVEEEARKTIRDNLPDKILPWTNFEKFQDLLYERQVKKEKLKKKAFYDRCLIDVLAYSIAADTDPNKSMVEDIRKLKYSKVFFLEKLPYREDEERKDEKLREKVDKILVKLYQKFGYEPVIIPAISKEDRLKMILWEVLQTF